MERLGQYKNKPIPMIQDVLIRQYHMRTISKMKKPIFTMSHLIRNHHDHIQKVRLVDRCLEYQCKRHLVPWISKLPNTLRNNTLMSLRNTSKFTHEEWCQELFNLWEVPHPTPQWDHVDWTTPLGGLTNEQVHYLLTMWTTLVNHRLDEQMEDVYVIAIRGMEWMKRNSQHHLPNIQNTTKTMGVAVDGLENVLDIADGWKDLLAFACEMNFDPHSYFVHVDNWIVNRHINQANGLYPVLPFDDLDLEMMIKSWDERVMKTTWVEFVKGMYNLLI